MQVSEAREREVCSAPGPLNIRSLRQLRASHFASWKAERAFCSELEEAVAEEMKREERIRSKEDGAVEAGNDALHLREHERDFRYGTDCAGGRILVWFCGVSRSNIDESLMFISGGVVLLLVSSVLSVVFHTIRQNQSL